MKYFLLMALILICKSQLLAQIYVNGSLLSKTTEKYTAEANEECDTIFSFSTIYHLPSGLTYDGNYLYTNASFRDTIYKFNLNGELSDRIPAPSLSAFNGGDLDFDGTFLWRVVEEDARVYKADPDNGNTISSFYLPGETDDPNYYGCAHDNGYIWITEYIDETLLKLDTTSGLIIDSFSINRMVLPLKLIDDELYGLEFIDRVPDGPMQLVKFDKTNGAVLDSTPWCLPYPLGLYKIDNNMWGLSGGLVGFSRIYEFDSLVTMTSSVSAAIIDIITRPNPFTTSTTIEYALNQPERVSITFYNHYGKQVDEIEQSQQRGLNQVVWTPENLANGIYYFRLQTGERVASGKVVLMRKK